MRTLAITQNMSADGSIELLGDWFDPGDQAEPVVIDVLLVAGQSNAVGYDAKPSELPADLGDWAVRYWWRCGDPPPRTTCALCLGSDAQ